MTTGKTIALTRYTFVGKVILNIYLFIYFWLCWVFVAASRLSPTAASRGYSLVEVLRFLFVVASLVAKHGL